MKRKFTLNSLVQGLIEANKHGKVPQYLNKLGKECSPLLPSEITENLTQKKSHSEMAVGQHMLEAGSHASLCNKGIRIILAALIHDIGKPSTAKISNRILSFHRHEVVGATIAYNYLKQVDNQLLSPQDKKLIVLLVRHHMFYFPEGTGDKAIRSWLYKIGRGTFPLLYTLRKADRAAKKENKNKPIETRHMLSLKERVKRLEQEYVIYKDEVNIQEEEIKQYRANTHEVYTNLIGIINKKGKQFNNIGWLRRYVRKVYGNPIQGSVSTL